MAGVMVGLALAVAATSGCVERPGTLFTGSVAAGLPAPGEANATPHRIFVATTRAAADNPAQMFSGERGAGLSFAQVDVSVPPGHRPGRIEWPRELPSDPRRHFTGYDARYMESGADFVAAVDGALKQRPEQNRTVLVFVHGYNTPYDAAVYRLTQFVHDTGYKGVPVLFTWASRGGVADYLYDRDSATAARDHLERTWTLLAQTSGRRGDIVAHSMGNWLAVEAMRQVQIRGTLKVRGRLGTVLLVAPDIDFNVFRTQMDAFPEGQRPFVVVISKDDRALRFSRRIAGRKERVGAADAEELASLGVTVVDLTNAGEEGRNHAKFADLPDVVRLAGVALSAGGTLSADDAPNRRVPMLGDLRVSRAGAGVVSVEGR